MTNKMFSASTVMSEWIGDYENVSDNLSLRLVGFKRYFDLSAKCNDVVVCENYGDLYLCPIVMIGDNSSIAAIIPITEGLLKNWGVTKEKLMIDAKNNMYEKSYVAPQVLSGILGLMSGNFVDPVVVTSKKSLYGAAMLFCGEVMKDVERIMGGRYYILPSSIHELLCVPANRTNLYDLSQMVKTINNNVVAAEDFLSNKIYVYDAGVFEVAG